MSETFISSSGSRIERALLYYALKDHGLTPWRDVESLELGEQTTDAIEHELQRCTTAIVWINEDILTSPYVAKVELPAIAAVSRRSGLRIIPVFDGTSPKEGCERLSQVSGIEVGESNGLVVDPGLTQDETAAKIAALLARAELRRAREAGLPPTIRLVSYRDTAEMRDDAVLNLDWRHHLLGDVLKLPAEQQLRSALERVTSSLMDVYGATEVTLAIKAHLPLAVAVGHAFAQPTGCTLRLPRGAGSWMTSAATMEANRLDQQAGALGPAGSVVSSVEASVSRNIEAGVNAYVSAGQRFRHRVMLAPSSGPGRDVLDDADTANVWARQIGGALVRLVDMPDVERTMFFLATPVELAVMIGWWANAGGTIDLMNWTGKTGPYERMWTLP
ncbi:MAG: SAVED domain-containing protein [Actinomycetota bacterium]